MEHKISVIIPAYNEEKNIYRCIQSIMDNDYKNLEIICIDDGSSDGTLQCIHSMALLDSRIIAVHQINGGVSSARNNGLSLATGEYVSFVDADDTIHPKYFSHLMKHMLHNNADLAMCEFNNSKNMPDYSNEQATNCHVLFGKDFFDIGFLRRSVIGKIIKREIIGSIKFDPLYQVGEDTIFNYSIINHNPQIKMVMLNELLYNYLRSNASQGNKGIFGYYNVGKWCLENWASNVAFKGEILLEGLKELLLFRQEGCYFPEELHLCKQMLLGSQSKLLREKHIPLISRILYSILIKFPFMYVHFVYAPFFRK